MSALPGISDLDLFRDGKSVVHLNAEVADGALDLGVAQQKLHRSQIAGPTVNQRRLCTPQRMRAKELCVQPNAGNPF